MEIPWILFVGSLIFLVAFYSWKALNFAYLRPRKLERFLRKQGFKGNRFNFLYGDTKEIMQFETSKKPINLDDDIKPRVVGFVTKTINTYGNYCFVWLGPKPSVIINDPEIAKVVLTKTETFGKTQANIPFFDLLITGVAAYEGEKWTKHRQILNPAFHFEKLKLMIPAFKLSCEEVVNRWEEKLILSGDGSGEIDVWPDLQTITSDAISRTAFGSSYEEGRKIFVLHKEQIQNIIDASRSLYLPGSRFLPTKRNRRIFEVAKEVKSTIMSLVDRRMKAIEAGEIPVNNDLLNLMLESNIREIEQHGKNKTFGMTMDDIVEECKLFYFAGQETTSVLLVWTMVLLSRHPEWQDRAAEEVLYVLGGKEKKTTPDYEALNRLKVVNMILHEVLRLYPPIATHARLTKKAIELGNNVALPSGIEVWLPIFFLHHDAETWGEDALEFNPERFRDGVMKAQRVGGGGIYFPFGYGPRICIGQAFALLEAKLVLAMILQKFSFQLSPSYVHAPTSMFITQPQHGAPLIFHRRE